MAVNTINERDNSSHIEFNTFVHYQTSVQMTERYVQSQTMPLFRAVVRWGIYPLSWAFILVMISLAASRMIEPKKAWLISIGCLVVFYIGVEQLIPYQRRWSMTWRTFLTDLKYLVAAGGTNGLVAAIFGLFAISISGDLSGPGSNWPIWVQLVAIFLIFEAIQYTLHRVMHQARGKVGTFLWMVHVAHHLPDKVYIVMHAALHPVNQVLTQPLAFIIPIWLMGYDPLVVATFLTINGMHGIISHFNVDVRMGWLNYIFVGPELHRYHHSANIAEAKNYGATLSIYDQLFGTFEYHPGAPPKQLGVGNDAGLPPYQNYLQVLKLPFVMPKRLNVCEPTLNADVSEKPISIGSQING